MALAAYEDGLCPRCRGELAETTAIEHDFNNPFATAAYLPVPGTPVQCHCCAALDRSEQQARSMNPQFPDALRHAVQLTPRR